MLSTKQAVDSKPKAILAIEFKKEEEVPEKRSPSPPPPEPVPTPVQVEVKSSVPPPDLLVLWIILSYVVFFSIVIAK